MHTTKVALVPIEDASNIKRSKALITWDDEEVHPSRRTFNIETFANLKKREQGWGKLKPVNEFLSTLDKDEGFYLVRMFIQAKRELSNLTDRKSVVEAIAKIDTIIAKSFRRLELPRRITEYVMADPGIIPPEVKESRSYDTPEMTFLTPDYYQVVTIITITKMLFPIFGEVIHVVKQMKDVDNDAQELLAFGIMNSLLDNEFRDIIVKLQNYTARLVSTSMTSDPMAVFRGVTEIRATHDRLAKTLVKGSVNFDLYRTGGGNFITYLAVTIRRASKNDTTSTKSAFHPRTPLDQGMSEDGRNVSAQEHEAHLLKEPIDVPILVNAAVEQFINRTVERQGIDRAMFDRTVRYYSLTLVAPTPINELIISMFIATPVGAAYCLKYVNMLTMVKLIVLFQIYAMNNGFEELVPLVSLMPTGIVKTTLSEGSDNRIIISEGRGDINSVNYILKLTEATLQLNDFQFFKLDEYVNTIIDFLVRNIHNYNVAPDIESMGSFGESVSSHGTLGYGGNIINEIFRFLHHTLTADDARRHR